MAKLFVSYSRKDSTVARKLIQAFKDMGQDVWVDWEDIPPAVDWLEQIFRGIEGSDAFIYLVSPHSIASEVCNVEAGRAALNNKRIIPVVLQDVDPKATSEIIRKLNWTFIREQDNFEEGLAKVKTAIELDLPWVEEHNRLQLRALEWHRKKEPSLLLHGRDLRNARHLVMTAGKKDPTPTNLQQTYIHYSNRDERRRIFLWFATAVAIIALSSVSYFAVIQRNLARENEVQARINEARAVENEIQAELNAAEADKQAEAARKAQIIAEAQRSAAKAQIYQSRPGELYTSTLLAIDSWLGARSPEAEEILRKNISLLPIPVKQMKHAGKIHSLEFNSNGDLFVTASADDTACVWKISDGENLFCADSSGSVNDAVFSPDGKLIVTGDDSGLVQILNAETGDVQNTFSYAEPVLDVNIRLDGKLLAVTRGDGTITIIDLLARKESYDLKASSKLKVSAFSPNGTYIAAGSEVGTVTLWNINARGAPVTSGRHKGAVLTIEFSPNSRYLVTGGADSYVVLAETSTGQESFRRLHEDWVEDIAFSPDSSWFVTVSDDRRIRTWNSIDGEERLRMSQSSFVQEVKVSSNGQWIATTGFDKTVRVWNASTGTEIFQIPLGGSGSALAFSPDGKYLVAGAESGETNIWDISAMPVPTAYIQLNGLAGDIQYSSSGDWIAATDDSRVWLLEPGSLSSLTTRPPGAPILQFKSNVEKVVFSPDSKWLGGFTDSNEVVIYNIDQKTEISVTPPNLVRALAFSPDSQFLITGDSAGNVMTWDVTTGNEENTLVEIESVNSIAVSSNLLAVGSTNKIAVIQLNSGQRLPDIEVLGDHQLLTFNVDGSLLASVSSSGQIQIWQYEGGKFRSLDSISKELAYSATFNPKNNQFAVGTTDFIYLINPLTGKEFARLPLTGAVNGVSFSTDGTTLVTSSLRVIQFWDIAKIENIATDDLVRAACSRLTANFNEAQWSALFGEKPFKLLCENLH